MRYRKVTCAVVGLALMLGLTTAALSAQGQGENPIVAALQSIQTTLSELVTAVNNLSTAEGNVLSTPLLFIAEPDYLTCYVTNVSNGVRSVKIESVTSTGAVVGGGSDPESIPPDATVAVGFAHPRARCRITVLDGVKSDVRGAMVVVPPGASDRSPVLAQ